ncbi:hypothetical protein DE146DRAFT_633549 [Phaeosphaeria sp. MPI-PUGE-AT-0046c]|nr:hypothetical protein DE146DRAFT_633549 [Phaeosphaeria sp. MPI-PUGE-AT-0046c]
MLPPRLRLVDPRGVFKIRVWGYKHRTPNSRPRTLKRNRNCCDSLHCAGSLREIQDLLLHSPTKLFACLERPAARSRLIVHPMSNTDMRFVGFGKGLCGCPFGRATPISSHQPYCKGRVAAKSASAGAGCSK